MINFAAFHAQDANVKIDFFMSIIDAIIDDSRSKGIQEVPLPQRAEAFAKVIVDSGIEPEIVCMIAALCLSRLTESPSASTRIGATPDQGA